MLKLVLTLAVLVALAWILIHFNQTRPSPGGFSPKPNASLTAKASDEQIRAALARYQTRLDQSQREVSRIHLEPLPSDDILVSKVGGAPYLLNGESMPRTADGNPMVLLAQINFAEVPAMAGYPSSGILQFFIVESSQRFIYGMDIEHFTPEAMQNQHSFRLRFIESIDNNSANWQVINPNPGNYETPHEPTKPRRMVFALSKEPISTNDVNFQTVVGFEPYDWVESEASRLKVDEDDFAERALPTASGHKIGGYPYFTQEDPRPAGTPLRLLLQLDTDDEMMWGDAGVGGFFIDPAALAKRDFSKVLYSWDCH